MANRNSDQSKATKDLIALNQSLHDLMKSQSQALGDMDMDRGEELIRIHNRFNSAIQADGQNIYKAKAPSQSVYDYMSRSLLGYNDLNRRGMKMSTGDPKRDAWLNKQRLERLFTTSDSQMASYFMASNSDICHIYDEIDSICAYCYQLEEAVGVIRDNIISAEQPGTDISYTVNFPNVSDTDLIATYQQQVREAFKYAEFSKKLRDHIIPKGIKYGTYYVLVTPYAEIGAKLSYAGANGLTIAGLGTRPLVESTYETADGTQVDNKSALLESCEELLLSLSDEEVAEDKKGKKTLPKEVEERMEIIRHNVDKLLFNEETTPPNVLDGLKLGVYESTDPELQKMVDNAIEEQKRRASYNTKFTKVRPDTGTLTSKQIDEIQGCDIKLVDPRQMVPIKIFDYVLGYYYFENYEYTRMGTTLTDIMSNQLNFNQRTLIIDNIVNAALRNLRYKDLIEGDQKLRTMILNCVLYAERRDSPIRVKFVPAEYVVPFQTNTDEYGNGQPVLLRSLFYGRLYTSLLLFNITAIITKSTDSEFYYLRESALDSQYSNQVSDLIDQFNDCNVDLIQIAQGDLLHGNRAINKRYYMNMGTADQRPFDMEVVSGQQIDIHNDFMNDLRKMMIGSTGVPAVMVDFIDEVEYATMLGMVNIRHLKRCNMISSDFDPSITEVIRRIMKYNSVSIPQEALDKMEIVLTKSQAINNNISADQLNNVSQVAQQMVDTFLGGQDTQPPEDQAFIKEAMVKDVTMRMASAVPWNIVQEAYENATFAASKKRLEQKVRTNRLQDESTESSTDSGDSMRY